MSQENVPLPLNQALDLFESCLVKRQEITLSSLEVSLDKAEEAAQRLATLFSKPLEPILFFLEGQLGAGKTTFSQFFITKWANKSIESVESPTYAYVIPYENNLGSPLYHFDLYRLSSSDEFIALGFDEYLKKSGISLIEWPDRLENLFEKESLVKLRIDYSDDLDMRLWSLSYKPNLQRNQS